MANFPALEILVREPEGFSVLPGPPLADGGPRRRIERVPCSAAHYSDDGSRLVAVVASTAATVYDCHTLAEVRRFEFPGLIASALSPRGTYLQSFQKAAGPQDRNVNVWHVDSGDPVYQHSQKSMSMATWPMLQFSADESVVCRMATNEIQFLDPSDLTKGILYKLRVPNVSAFELAKSPGSHLATFVPEAKGSPASVQIFSSNKDEQSQVIARRSFFRCSTATFHWNKGSSGLLVVAKADVDKTNQSYYGESKLNYLTTDGNHEGLVPLKKEGPVHDVQWSYSGLEFAVVYGFMPARTTIFNKKCNPLFELGEGPYNTIRWNPKGKFICIAGFGNLPGDMAFWDYSRKNLLGKTKAEWSVTSEWSPDGRYFMTATTAPRLQIDNGIKIFYHDGTLHFKKMFEKLYQVDWKPEEPEKFGDLSDLVNAASNLKIVDSERKGQSSKLSEASSMASSTIIAKATSVAAKPDIVAAKPAAYRPPNARNSAQVQEELFGGLAPMSSQEMSKSTLRNKKRREKQKEKKAAEASCASAADDDG